jgi:hypothetical protein
MPPVQKPVEEVPKEIAKTEAPTEFSVVQSIFQKNNNVEISRCWKNGKKYFRAQMNVYDGGDKIYDETGKQVASCTPMSHADALCSMDKYEVIYTPSKNIWGHKGIDVLEIAN